MSRCSQLTILFCIKIFFGLFKVVVTNEAIFESMSIKEKQFFFGTADGSVPEFQLVKLLRPRRSKRTAQEILEVMFNDSGTLFTTTLSTVRDHDLIGWTTTGIWLAESKANAYHGVSYTPKPDILERIGEFDLFQSVDGCSAITRFWDSEGKATYTGRIKQDYNIKSVPQRFEDKYSASSNNLSSPIEDQDETSSLVFVIFKDPIVPQENFRRRRHVKNWILPDRDLLRRRRQIPEPFDVPNVVYPKLLISPDYGAISNVDVFVKNLIVQLNAVDVLYRQLRNPEVRLRIAGIIIPGDEFATPYIAPSTVNNVTLISSNVLRSTNAYFLHEMTRFPFNTYDIVFIMATSPLYYYTDFGMAQSIAGTALRRSACDRVNKHTGGAAIIQYRPGFGIVVPMAHELGHIFDVDHDGHGRSAECQIDDGYTMVTHHEMFKTLKWSECSKRAFSSFLRSEDATCMHNRPNVKPYAVKSMPGTWLSITGQCQNRFSEATGQCRDRHPILATPSCENYECFSGGRCELVNHSPMEGSFCMDGTRCINQTCVII